MGFIITFNYHKRKESGYDMETSHKLTKKIGTDEEEVPLEQVVMLIKSQLARRDIFIANLEIHEFVKKKVKFKEVKGGFVIKDKKFLMDEIQGIHISAPAESAETVLHPHELIHPAKPVPQQPSSNGLSRPIRVEVFDPSPIQLAKLAGKYKLTPGKRYGIYKEWGVGAVKELQVTQYLVRDDRNVEVEISAEYFTAVGTGLLGGNFDEDTGLSNNNHKENLLFQGRYLEDMPRVVPNGRKVDYDVVAEEGHIPDLSQLRGKI